MKIVDTDSKGLVVFQTPRGTYFALEPKELDDALGALSTVKHHLIDKQPRVRVDSRG